jgi:hypothetical protein
VSIFPILLSSSVGLALLFSITLDRREDPDENQFVATQSSLNCARCDSRYILDIDPTENGDLLLCGNCGPIWRPLEPPPVEPILRSPGDRFIDRLPVRDR